MWLKENKWKIITCFSTFVLLIIAFYTDGGVPEKQDGKIVDLSPVLIQNNNVLPLPTKSNAVLPDNLHDDTALPESIHSALPIENDKNNEKMLQTVLDCTPSPAVETNSDNIESSSLPLESQNSTAETTAATCTISISCQSILDNMDYCNTEKKELVPKDGWVLMPTTVSFYEGESVFNVLQRTCKRFAIHMEFVNTPIYKSTYIEGISNLYEFDVGERSGWMYKVNDWFPNYGCSRYKLKSGDVICWVYTCDLGRDVKGEYAAGGQKEE